MKQKSVPKNVSMYPRDWAIVDALAQEYGFRKVSQALQLVVRQYAQLRDAQGLPLLLKSSE